MPTPVEVSYIKRSAVNRSGVEGLGGTWRDRPWYLSEDSVIWEIKRPDDRRQWDFYVQDADKRLPVIVVSDGGQKYLATAGEPLALLKLPQWPQDQPIPS
jgi:hypothetical protein